MHLGNEKPRERRWIITVVDVETGETATGFAAAGEQRKKTNELLDQLRCDVA